MTNIVAFGEPIGQGWTQIGELALALVLCTVIGLERELAQKAAGLRTHTLVGVGAALIMLISKYGFSDVVGPHVGLDPSRIAAQIVSGIGFIGGGLIFVRRDAVRGLTTAAVIWMSAAVGMACGAGLWLLAIVVTAGHFLVLYGYPAIGRLLPRSKWAPSNLTMTYRGGQGVLRNALAACTDRGVTVAEISTEQVEEGTGGRVQVALTLRGVRDPGDLAASLSEIDGVVTVRAGDEERSTD
ncbi:MgtC/SapB family protein [Actinocatenispora comari]|jgi:putative Mg2+ transporter-C (MgtC) family protein|uniref:Putative magnesium transport MgtC family protein n=1 Tax=Actinocatenispora comari TaxID=2807577 RepID=A0A8J4AD05_9ACTN|nr:MgtC/SapB family protein [Actinocatenispora comari]GIL29276.1 putative magnesium transport MgtC family protein [Actinocatenispora comari]